MSNSQRTTPRLRFFRRLWKPALATGAGGAAISVWWDEILAVGDEILGLILLPVLAGVLFLMDIFFFKSRMPDRGEGLKPAAGERKH